MFSYHGARTPMGQNKGRRYVQMKFVNRRDWLDVKTTIRCLIQFIRMWNWRRCLISMIDLLLVVVMTLQWSTRVGIIRVRMADRASSAPITTTRAAVLVEPTVLTAKPVSNGVI